jgi:Fusaric acid resistance protein-like
MMESTHNEGVVAGTRMSRMGQEIGFGTMLAISCLISYWLITSILAREYSVSRDNDLLGGMWAVVATIFVFRYRTLQSDRAAISRTLATVLSFALCFLYFLIFPFNVFGMAAVIWIGTVILGLIGRSEDIVTTAITTAVVFVVAGISRGPAWIQPILRLVDTGVGILVGSLAARVWVLLRQKGE